MNNVVRILTVVLGAYFTYTGIMHFIVPDGLPGPMAWMYDLSPTLHVISGIAEIVAGVVLLASGVLGKWRNLVPWAGLGLVAVMIGAAAWHLQRGEPQSIVINVILALVSAFVAYSTWKQETPAAA